MSIFSRIKNAFRGGEKSAETKANINQWDQEKNAEALNKMIFGAPEKKIAVPKQHQAEEKAAPEKVGLRQRFRNLFRLNDAPVQSPMATLTTGFNNDAYLNGGGNVGEDDSDRVLGGSSPSAVNAQQANAGQAFGLSGSNPSSSKRSNQPGAGGKQNYRNNFGSLNDPAPERIEGFSATAMAQGTNLNNPGEMLGGVPSGEASTPAQPNPMGGGTAEQPHYAEMRPTASPAGRPNRIETSLTQEEQRASQNQASHVYNRNDWQEEKTEVKTTTAQTLQDKMVAGQGGHFAKLPDFNQPPATTEPKTIQTPEGEKNLVKPTTSPKLIEGTTTNRLPQEMHTQAEKDIAEFAKQHLGQMTDAPSTTSKNPPAVGNKPQSSRSLQ